MKNIIWRTNRQELFLDANFCAHKISQLHFGVTIYVYTKKMKKQTKWC